MSYKILDGYKTSEKILKKIKKKVDWRKINHKRVPGLAVICIGKNTASLLYIKKKKIACKKAGFFFCCFYLEKTKKEKEIIYLIKQLNKNKKIDGILIQLPLPHSLNYIKIINSIDPKKDVDGLHSYNIGRVCQKYPFIRSCTARGIITLLKEYKIKVKGLNAVIVGDSNLVGRPMNLELLMLGCTTTVTHKFTKNIKKHLQKADLIIVAVGKPNFLYGDWIKLNSIIIDVGIHKIEKNNKIIGDINFSSVSQKAKYITPVPGGVGPMTVISLLQNTLEICEKTI